jgi:hypothetical protein
VDECKKSILLHGEEQNPLFVRTMGFMHATKQDLLFICFWRKGALQHGNTRSLLNTKTKIKFSKNKTSTIWFQKSCPTLHWIHLQLHIIKWSCSTIGDTSLIKIFLKFQKSNWCPNPFVEKDGIFFKLYPLLWVKQHYHTKFIPFNLIFNCLDQLVGHVKVY